LSAYYSFSALTLSVASYHWRLLSGVLLVGGCWHEILYRLDALPVTLPAVSKHWRKSCGENSESCWLVNVWSEASKLPRLRGERRWLSSVDICLYVPYSLYIARHGVTLLDQCTCLSVHPSICLFIGSAMPIIQVLSPLVSSVNLQHQDP